MGVSLVGCNISYSQNWIENKITNHFKSVSVWDFDFSKDALWSLSANSDKNVPIVTKCKDESINTYYINHVSNGLLNDFLQHTNNESHSFAPTSLLARNDKVWIFDKSRLMFAIIQYDSIRFYKCDSDNLNNILTTNCYVDVEGNLYILNKYRSLIEKQNKKFRIFKSNGSTEFIECDNFINFESNYIPKKIFFHNKSTYIVADDENTSSSIYLYKDNNIIETMKLEYSSIINCYLNNDNIFLFCYDKSELQIVSYILVLDLNFNTIGKYIVPKLLGFKTCSFFVSNNNNAYISDGSGFYEFNYVSNNLSQIEEKVSKECYGNAFRRLKINDNIIYGCYDGIDDLTDCQLLSDNGLYLYKIEK